MPVPVLTTFVEPEEFWIVPENVPLALPLPIVKLGAAPNNPATLLIVPPPLSPATEVLTPLISKQRAAGDGQAAQFAPRVAAPLANCSVPPRTVVPPLYVLAPANWVKPLPWIVKP